MYRGTPPQAATRRRPPLHTHTSTQPIAERTASATSQATLPQPSSSSSSPSTNTMPNTAAMPKRPPTAYLLYQTDQDLPGKWNRLTPKQRAKYEQMHETDKARYEAEKQAWEEAGGKSQHDVPKPKQSMTPYMSFSQEQNVGAKWSAEPDDVKDAYKEKFRVAMETYKEEMAAYDARFGPTALEAPDWPKPPLAVYMSFAQQSRDAFKEKFPDLSTAKIGAQLGAAWNAMSDADKQVFVDAYDAEYEAWTKAVDEYESQWGEIAYIKKARAKAAQRAKAEKTKEKAKEKREMQREKNKAVRERKEEKARRDREKAAEQRAKLREKKQKEKEQEKAIRRGLAMYKRENRERVKRSAEFADASAAEVNQAMEQKFAELSPTTQKAWARKADQHAEAKAAAAAAPKAKAAKKTAAKATKAAKAAAPKKGKAKAVAPAKGATKAAKAAAKAKTVKAKAVKATKVATKAKVAGKKRGRVADEAIVDDDNAEEGSAAMTDDGEPEDAEPAASAAPAKKAKSAKKAAPATAAASASKKPAISAADLRKGLKFYISQQRAKVEKKNPGLKKAEVTKIIKQTWDGLSDNVHAKHTRQAIEAMQADAELAGAALQGGGGADVSE